MNKKWLIGLAVAGVLTLVVAFRTQVEVAAINGAADVIEWLAEAIKAPPAPALATPAPAAAEDSIDKRIEDSKEIYGFVSSDGPKLVSSDQSDVFPWPVTCKWDGGSDALSICEEDDGSAMPKPIPYGVVRCAVDGCCRLSESVEFWRRNLAA